MRGIRAALIAWVLLACSGCADVSGLSQIAELDCAPNCESEAAPAAESSPFRDAAEGTEGTTEASRTDDGQSEAASDEGGADVAQVPGASEGVPPYAPSESPPPEFDSGCGPLNAVGNCSACGDECAAMSESVTRAICSGQADGLGATCSYTCATGYLDCNAASAPPDLDGCECYAPETTCKCGDGCPVSHSNDGLGTTYYACAGDGPQSLAMAACAAFTGDASQCDAFDCPTDGGIGDGLVCSDLSPTSCACWDYAGENMGHVYNSGDQGQCYCPGASDPSYD